MNVHEPPRYEPDRHLFAKRVLVELQAALPGRRMRYRRNGFRIDVDGVPDGVHLFNAYREYCAAPEAHRSDVISNWIEAVSSVVDGGTIAFGTLAEERANLVPSIRTRYELHAAFRKTDSGDPESRRTWALVSPHLAVTLVVERPRVLGDVLDRSLKSWGISFEEGLSIAIQNLKSRGPAMWERPSSGLFVSAWQDEHHAARVLIPGVFGGLPITGETILCIPRRDRMIVADSADPGALRALGEMAMKEWSTGAWPLSPIPLRVCPTMLEPYLPPEGHPSRPMFELMRREAAAQNYAAQRLDLLAADGAKDPCATFVASYMRLGPGPHADRSFAVWTKGVVTLLPETDLVVLQELAGPPSDCRGTTRRRAPSAPTPRSCAHTPSSCQGCAAA